MKPEAVGRDDVGRTLMAHDILLRALLTHLAMSDPQGFAGLVAGFVHSKAYASTGADGEVTREVAQQLTAMIEEIAAGLREGR